MISRVVRSLLALGVLWHAVRPGVWTREVVMAESGPLSSVKAILVKVDPARVRFTLDTATRDYGLKGAWTIDAVPANAVVALNAGQFIGGVPWGWLVRDGVEHKPPGTGTLGMSFVIDRAGRAQLVMPSELAPVRETAVQAFQSYPALLVDGEMPWELRASGRGVDLAHRDSRLAIGLLGDGTIVVALTRFTGLGRAGATAPWGPTVPEMAAFMRSLGCRRAMLLDGGLSSQLVVRGGNGRLSRWPNWRPVPLALIAHERL